MAFFPNNNNYLNYRNIFNIQSFSQPNNYQFIQPMNPYINNQFMVNQAIPAQNIKTLRRNNSSIVPMPYGMKFLEYNPNNIYVIGDEINDYEMLQKYHCGVIKKHNKVLDELKLKEYNNLKEYIDDIEKK